MMIGTDENPGREAQTLLLVKKRGYYKNMPVTLVELKPVTGRQHQLRVHCAWIGHPIGEYEDRIFVLLLLTSFFKLAIQHIQSMIQ